MNSIHLSSCSTIKQDQVFTWSLGTPNGCDDALHGTIVLPAIHHLANLRELACFLQRSAGASGSGASSRPSAAAERRWWNACRHGFHHGAGLRFRNRIGRSTQVSRQARSSSPNTINLNEFRDICASLPIAASCLFCCFSLRGTLEWHRLWLVAWVCDMPAGLLMGAALTFFTFLCAINAWGTGPSVPSWEAEEEVVQLLRWSRHSNLR